MDSKKRKLISNLIYYIDNYGVKQEAPKSSIPHLLVKLNKQPDSIPMKLKESNKSMNSNKQEEVKAKEGSSKNGITVLKK